MGSSKKLVVVNYIDIQQISCSAQTGAAFTLAGLMLSCLGTATTMYSVLVYMYMYMGHACTSIRALAMYVYTCRGNEYYMRAACVYM